MLITVDFEHTENNPDRYIIVDVRSPSEYAESTITGAVNIPLFCDEERARIGTLYKQESKASAVKAGVEYVSGSLPQIYDRFASLAVKQKKFLIFCARGGMRSEAVGSFLASVGFPVIKLGQGYKGYRQHIVRHLPELINKISTVTLYGKTGAGKTLILHEIKKLGYDVLDLEGCAGHRGSLLGAIGLPQKRSQKRFETLLYDSLKSAKSDIIFTEGESKRIGNIYLPGLLMEKMNTGRKLLIEADIATRKGIIKQEYIGADFDKTSVIPVLEKLTRYVGKERIANYKTLIETESYDTVIEELMTKYYDIAYNTPEEEFERSFFNFSPARAASEIVEYIYSGYNYIK
ncbi:MAG: tRNA 2-selenouridine(34) synthase MnmH [Deferribacteraceae bacterium]|jgi:tRNA 2-selenouridine synthase|nr:tRNA 2-selenouridine(34) synthase MnmH [Deferribacteraceae bacterium]